MKYAQISGFGRTVGGGPLPGFGAGEAGVGVGGKTGTGVTAPTPTSTVPKTASPVLPLAATVKPKVGVFNVIPAPVMYFAGLAAMGISYSRNRSILWAFGTGFVAPVYLAYIGFQAFSQGGGLKKQLQPLKNGRRHSKRGKSRRRGRR